MSKALNIGVVGATGLVGETFLSIMEKRNTPVAELRPFASERSKGNKARLGDREFEIQCLKEGCFDGLDLVFFSSGDDISLEWAPKAVAAGAYALDNLAAFRMSPEHLLVVPEVNGKAIDKSSGAQLITNPNCSTIQLVVVLAALNEISAIKSIRVASYQAVSGAGKEGLAEFKQQAKAFTDGTSAPNPQIFPHAIGFNCLPHIGSFNDQGFCSEEVKIMSETKKILGRQDLDVSAFCVRVPVSNAHSEAAWVSFDKELTYEEISAKLSSAKGIQFIPHDSPEAYPIAERVSGEDDIYVGRVHAEKNPSQTWLMWVVGDNLLKGAALNGLQIAEHIFDI